MSYYKTCPNCGAALDPDERCDCVKYPNMPKSERDAFKRAIQEPATRAQIIEILQGAGLLK